VVANLLPDALKAAASGSNLTVSTWRTFPLSAPDLFTIPAGNATVRVFMPISGAFDPSLWCCLTWFDRNRPPLLGAERFHITGGTLARVLTDLLMKPEAIDALRKLSSRPRQDTWVRHDWRAVDIIGADNIDMPNRMCLVEGLSPEEAAAKMAALRAPTSNAQWLAARQADRAKRDAEAATKHAPVEHAEATPATEAAKPAEPVVLTIEERTLRKTREKLARSKTPSQPPSSTRLPPSRMQPKPSPVSSARESFRWAAGAKNAGDRKRMPPS
jgi:hypothetical protein